MALNPYANYKQISISTMSPGEQVVLLFNEAIKNMRLGAKLLREENFEAAEKCTEKSKRIFDYLMKALDRKYEISLELYKFYSFFNREIIRAEIRRDASVLEAVIPLVEEMRDTFSQAEKLSHINKGARNVGNL